MNRNKLMLSLVIARSTLTFMHKIFFDTAWTQNSLYKLFSYRLTKTIPSELTSHC